MFNSSFNANALFILATVPSGCETGCQLSTLDATFTAGSATTYALGLNAFVEAGAQPFTLPKQQRMLTTTLSITNVEEGFLWELTTVPQLWDLVSPITLTLDPTKSTLNTAQNSGTVGFDVLSHPAPGFHYGLEAGFLTGQVPQNMPMTNGVLDVEVVLTIQVGSATITLPVNNIELRNIFRPTALGAPFVSLEFVAADMFNDGILVPARLPFGTSCLTGSLTLRSLNGSGMNADLAFAAFVGCNGSIVTGVFDPNLANWNDLPVQGNALGLWENDLLELNFTNGLVRESTIGGFLIPTYELGLFGNITVSTS